MTQTLQLAQMDAADLVQSAFRNRLINGAFLIDQRNQGAQQTFTAGASNTNVISSSVGTTSGFTAYSSSSIVSATWIAIGN